MAISRIITKHMGNPSLCKLTLWVELASPVESLSSCHSKEALWGSTRWLLERSLLLLPLPGVHCEGETGVPQHTGGLPTAWDVLEAQRGSFVTRHPWILISLLCMRWIHLFMERSRLQISINVQAKPSHGKDSSTQLNSDPLCRNCGVGEDSWESLGQQGDPTSPS